MKWGQKNFNFTLRKQNITVTQYIAAHNFVISKLKAYRFEN